jgi:4-hydroxy-3-methylbut-2-enyl diphosphate reductase
MQTTVSPQVHMRIILAQPRGFCAGVVRAIEIVERALAALERWI